jgi:hypothetical protein
MPKMTEVRIPFAKMSFTPDVPSSALGANEYNYGQNVETDVRGIRSTLGDNPILASVPGTPTFISGGFRADGLYWFIVAVDEGHWYASSGGAWTDITPAAGDFSHYNQATNITDTWNGTVPFFNDTSNPPMVWLDGDSRMTMYSNTIPIGISSATLVSTGPTVYQITFSTPYAQVPYVAGEKVTISGTGSSSWDGTHTVDSCTTTTVNVEINATTAYPGNGVIAPEYSWNYNTNWRSYHAKFLRIYNTPNVGSILVAGNLVVTQVDGTIVEYPVTVQWSQAFGLNQAPTTWTPTITNVANQLEVPLRGPAIDAFPCGGQLFLCSYWDTVVFSPLNYAATNAPILGVRLYNQGRGMLSSNCWGNTDQQVFGIDARDVWMFDGQNFQGIGNQRVKNWLFDQLDQTYANRVFVQINTQKNQVEIYYPTTAAQNGVPNKMLSYRYDLDIWNAPRDVSSATMTVESPIFTLIGGVWTFDYATRCVTYARGAADVSIVQKDQGFSFIGNTAIASEFKRSNIRLSNDYSGKVLLHRLLPEVNNIDVKGVTTYPSTGNITVTIESADSIGAAINVTTPVTMEINTNYPWTQIDQNASRINNIDISNSSNTDAWICSAVDIQFTPVEDDR